MCKGKMYANEWKNRVKAKSPTNRADDEMTPSPKCKKKNTKKPKKKPKKKPVTSQKSGCKKAMRMRNEQLYKFFSGVF